MYNSNYKSAQNARAPSKEAVRLRTRCWGRRMFGHHLLLTALASEIGSGAAEKTRGGVVNRRGQRDMVWA